MALNHWRRVADKADSELIQDITDNSTYLGRVPTKKSRRILRSGIKRDQESADKLYYMN